MQDWWRNGEGSAASMDGEDLSAAFALRFIVKTQVTSSVLHTSPPSPINSRTFSAHACLGVLLRASRLVRYTFGSQHQWH